ncbi:MAG: CDC48 family AAA ATPase [Candidatus Ranarchaeia archaeon]|jgi:transitional endoplasmic reticulum ATPase
MANVRLKVQEAERNDAGRGIARLPKTVMTELSIQTGDIVGIKGKRKTAAIVWPSHKGDQSIRIDGTLRRNSGVAIDEYVEVSKINYKTATSVKLSPSQPLRLVGGDRYLKQQLIQRPMTRGDILRFRLMNNVVEYTVVAVQPTADAVIVGPQTQLTLLDQPSQKGEQYLPAVTYEDIGGLHEPIRKVRELVELPIRHPELFAKLGIEPPNGILLHGPPGTGKTLLAKAVAHETNANFTTISGPEIMSKFYGQSEENLRKIFLEARENSPSIIFIDELDAIAPSREEAKGEVERRVVAQLLALMDGLQARGRVVVIGATNRPNDIDPALRRPGRFDREIEITVPDRAGRLEILQIHTRGMPLEDSVDLKTLAELTHGFVGADLAALGKEAAMGTLRRILPEIDIEVDEIPQDLLKDLTVTMNDFQDALRGIEPSALREVIVQRPNTKWKDIGGLEKVKKVLQETVEWPLKYHEMYKKRKIRAPRGVLLYGPPGTGKTLLAKAVAGESEANFISIKGPELLSKWVGESEKGVRKIFKKARQVAPAVIFFDEFDAIASTRGSGEGDSGVGNRVLSQILTEMDGLVELQGVTIIAATNRPDLIDRALIRPGRFDSLLAVMAPDQKAREQIFKIHTQNLNVKTIDFEELAKQTQDYTGADIEAIVQETTMRAVRRLIKKYPDPAKALGASGEMKTSMKDFVDTIKEYDTRPTIQKDLKSAPSDLYS